MSWRLRPRITRGSRRCRAGSRSRCRAVGTGPRPGARHALRGAVDARRRGGEGRGRGAHRVHGHRVGVGWLDRQRGRWPTSCSGSSVDIDDVDLGDFRRITASLLETISTTGLIPRQGPHPALPRRVALRVDAHGRRAGGDGRGGVHRGRGDARVRLAVAAVAGRRRARRDRARGQAAPRLRVLRGDGDRRRRRAHVGIRRRHPR